MRGRATYSANLNASNPIGTVQSIEHTLRNLDKFAFDQQNRAARVEKELHDYQMQADRPFEHEERLKDLIARQAVRLRVHEEVAKQAAEYMRASDTSIRELPIRERTPPQTGSITGTAVAKGPTHIAVATAANSFISTELSSPDAALRNGRAEDPNRTSE
jgi:hypothetical protein